MGRSTISHRTGVIVRNLAESLGAGALQQYLAPTSGSRAQPPNKDSTYSSLSKGVMSVPVFSRQNALAMLAAIAAAGVAANPAQAQGKLEAHFTATLAGIPIAKGTWAIDIADDHYTAAASAATAGLLRVFASGQATGAVRGTLAGERVTSSNYAVMIKTAKRTDDIQITMQNGAVKEFHAEPKDTNEDLVPLTDAQRKGVIDPMTASLLRVPGTGEVMGASACRRSLPIFDGRVRYNLELSFKRMDTVKAERGYAGPAVVCSVRFVPLGGYVPGRFSIRFLTEQRDMEIWLAPIAGTRVIVPFRFETPTPLGHGVIEATQFVSLAQPGRTATKGVRSQ
jgi:hypothetical protein